MWVSVLTTVASLPAEGTTPLEKDDLPLAGATTETEGSVPIKNEMSPTSAPAVSRPTSRTLPPPWMACWVRTTVPDTIR